MQLLMKNKIKTKKISLFVYTKICPLYNSISSIEIVRSHFSASIERRKGEKKQIKILFFRFHRQFGIFSFIMYYIVLFLLHFDLLSFCLLVMTFLFHAVMNFCFFIFFCFFLMLCGVYVS